MQVDANVVWQEWQNISRAQTLVIDLVEHARLLRRLEETLTLLRTRGDFAARALAQGNATLQVVAPYAAKLTAPQTERDATALVQEQRWQSLAALLGLQPSVRPLLSTRLQVPAIAPAEALRLLSTVPQRRPDLLALQLGDRAQQAGLRAAILAQFPAITLGPNYGNDTSRIESLGPSVSVTLPLFNRNRGQIAIQRATREQLREDGHAAVQFQVYQQPNANSVAISAAVQKALAAFQPQMPPGVVLSNWCDQSTLVTQSASSVRDAILIGLGLAGLVLLAFLRSLQVTLVAMLVVPATLATTVLLLYVLGLRFNIITLGGIAAAGGLVIDDVITMVEHLARLAGAGRPESKLEGKRGDAVLRAGREFLPPLTGSSMATLLVFLPLVFLSGVTGAFFKALSMTMAAALFILYGLTALAPLIVLGASMLSTTAVFAGLWVTGIELNITAIMGMTMIIGIGTEMATFLVSEYVDLSREMPPRQALLVAARNRFRPIAMATLAAILTLMPLALAMGAGSGMQQPLAIAIISGLLIQFPLVLLVMPVLIGLTEPRDTPARKEDAIAG